MRKMKDSGIEWIGQIPNDWKCCKQKYLITLLNGRAYKDSEFEEDGKYKILRVGNLFTNPVWYSSSLELEPNKYCQDGDLLYSWSMSYAPVIWHGEKVIYHYHIWKTVLSEKISKMFAYYYLISLTNALQAEIHETTMGFITMGVMNNAYIAFPPLVEQQRIADFLDEKCGEIDSIRSDVQREIEILNDYKKSIITEAVTKGLNPKAKLKDSGIEWIGKIPEGWNVFRIKYLATEPNTLFTDGDWINGDIITEDGIRYLTSGNVGEGKFKYQGEGHISLETFNEMHCLKAVPGDLMICRLNLPIGRCCIIPDDEPFYVIAVDNVILRPNSNVDKKYAMYCMNTPGYAMDAEMAAGGTTMKRISRTDLGNLRIPVPPLSEQKAIADYLDEKCSEIDATIADKQKQLETLDEYKKSLIFEYVTGKKEVS